MTLPRKSLVSLNDTPFYHCVSRCVRRAFLCGVDPYSGKNYEHRRGWLEYLLLRTADVFAIKLCSYAVMSNHYHVVLHVRSDIADKWSDLDVVKRWHRLFKPTPFSQRFIDGESLRKVEWVVLNRDIKLWRSRLCDISWYMRIINERIARKANAEDRCTGRFWEGRFKSQALLGIKQHSVGIPFDLKNYIELVDWTGRAIRRNKRGSINEDLPPILKRLNLSNEHWCILTTEFEAQFKNWVGSEHIVRQVCEDKAYQRIPSLVSNQRLFG